MSRPATGSVADSNAPYDYLYLPFRRYACSPSFSVLSWNTWRIRTQGVYAVSVSRDSGYSLMHNAPSWRK